MIKVLDPALSWRGQEDDTIWKDDPVHPSEAAYSLLADGVNTIHLNMESGAKRPRSNSFETGTAGPSSSLSRQRGGQRDRPFRGGQRGAGAGRGDRHQAKRGSYRGH
jgi:hypothetical protein